MDFSWQPETLEIYEQALKFGASLGFKGTSEAEFDYQQWARLGEFGAFGLPIKEEFGGSGLSALATVKVLEALGKSVPDTGILFAGAAHTFACIMPIYEQGSDYLLEKYLPSLVSGKRIAANAISEANAGSDTSKLDTTAQKDGEYYFLNGSKSFVTNGSCATVFIVYATTNPSAGYLGQSVFVLDTEEEAQGLTVAPAYDKLGLSSAPLNQIVFDHYRIHRKQMIANEGQGARIFSKSMHWERICLFAIFLGVLERDIEQCISYANDRKQHKKSIGQFQAISHRIADMKIRLESARWLLYVAAWKIDQQEVSALDASISKVAISEALVQSGLDIIKIHGGLGYITDSGIDRSLRDGIGSTIFSGTNEMQRELICHRLGLKQ
ncbi:MAG: acyl-CoA dehydrogenase family protein [Pseudomonadales bacterium]